jgi:hypothetical protein
LRGKDKENCGLRPVQAKCSGDLILPIKKLGMVTHACHPRYGGSINRRREVQAGPMHKCKTLFEKYIKTKRARA